MPTRSRNCGWWQAMKFARSMRSVARAQRRLVQRVDDVEEERLAGGARLLRPVEHGDRLHALRQRGDEALVVEGTIETDLDDADLLAGGGERVDSLVRRLAAGAHQ